MRQRLGEGAVFRPLEAAIRREDFCRVPARALEPRVISQQIRHAKVCDPMLPESAAVAVAEELSGAAQF